MKTLRLLQTLLLACCASLAARAQVQVVVAVKPPYSAQVKDYILDGSNLLITLINTSGSTQKVRLIPSLTGNNGVKVQVREDFMPAQPITLAAGETKMLTGAALKAANSNITDGDVQRQGISTSLVLQTGNLPEGTYQLCVKVKSYDVAGATLGSEGCASLLIMQYDPPIVMNPANTSNIKPQTPQLIPFSWTPSGPAGKTRYSLRLVDMTAVNLFNPNDAFLENGVAPTFKQDNILTNSYTYDLGKPKLIEGHQYAVMVVAYDPQGKSNYKNGGRSQVTTFTYKTTGPKFQGPGNIASADSTPKQDDPQGGACAASTKWNGTLNKTSKDNIADGTDIAVGKFVMKGTKFTKKAGSYDGNGEILVPFLNTRVQVEFKGIRINGENRMYEGIITGKVTSSTVIDQAMSSQKTGILEKVPDMDALLGYLEQGTREVNKLNPAKVPIDLPVHFSKDEFTIGIVGLIFEPTEAYANALLNTPIPQAIGNDYLLLATKGIPIQPGGYGTSEVKLALAKDATVSLSAKSALTFKGGVDKTFAVFDCNGFKSITLNGAWTLPRTAALPVDGSGAVIADEDVVVKVPFVVQGAKGMDDILLDNLSFSHPFVVPQARDFVITATGASLDFSDTKNGAAFKTAYPAKANQHDWKGVFVKAVSLTLPGYLKKNGGRVTLAAKHALIDKMGFSGNISAAGNLLDNGSAAGLPLGLDSVRLSITNNNLTGGGMGGDITLPLGDNATVGFKASISSGGANGATVKFQVLTKDEVNANLFLAKLKLEPNSIITMQKESGVFTAAANLNGELTMGFNSKPEGSNVGKLSVPALDFEGLSIKAQESAPPQFDIAAIALEGAVQAKISDGFEVNLKDVSFEKKNGGKSAGLSLAMGLSLFGGTGGEQNGAGVTTDFTVWAKQVGNVYKYDKATLNEIGIDAQLGVAQVVGKINIYDEDPTFGNGFRGAVKATVTGVNVGVDVTVQFGRTLKNKGDYKYWYFDAMVDAGATGIPIPGTVASIYGFGGGAWCNMERQGGPDVIKPGAFDVVNKGGAAPTKSGVSFVPKKGIGGFKAAVLFGITGSREAFNGDLAFTMELNTQSLGVNSILLEGNGYLMQSPQNAAKRDPNKAFLYCNAKIGYQTAPRIMYGSFGAHLNVLELIKGGGNMAFKFDMPDKNNPASRWYIKVGEWTKSNPFEDDARLNAQLGFDAKVVKLKADFRGYFMVGNDLPNGLPPLPDYIYQYVKDDGAQKKAPLPSVVGDANNLAIALGAGLKLTAGFDFFVVDAELNAEAAFDVLLANINATCDGKEAGFEGWYAQGQAYAYVHGEAHLFRKIPIADLVCGAVLQVKLPNPSWVRGDIIVYIDVFGIDAGEYHGTFERGKLCENMKTEFKPFDHVKMVRSVTPTHGTTKVSPFTAVDVKLGLGWHSMTTGILQAYDAYLGSSRIYTYDYSFALKTADGKKEIPCEITYVGEQFPYKHIRLYPTATLEENTKYKVHVRGEIKDQKEENVVVEFTTGLRPDHFGFAEVRVCYPFPGQRYVMKQNAYGNPQKGMIELKQNMAYLLDGPGTPVVRLTDVKTKQITDIPVTDFNSEQYGKTLTKIYYTLPADLKKSNVYHAALLFKPNGGGTPKTLWEGYHFRTSRYNSMAEKLDDYKVKKVGYTWGTQAGYQYNAIGAIKNDWNPYNNAVLMLQGEEPLEYYEMYQFNTNLVGHQNEEGQLIYAHEKSNWLGELKSKYYYRNTSALTKADNTFLNSLGGIDGWVDRAHGFPFYSKHAEVFSTGYPDDVFWMKNIYAYEMMMKLFKYLGPNESIARPEMPLTEAEIAAASQSGGGMNHQIQGGKKAAHTESYYALMDFTPQIGAEDKVALDKKWLDKAKAKDAFTLFKTWDILQKLGDPQYPRGIHSIDVTSTDPAAGGGKVVKSLLYNYKPEGGGLEGPGNLGMK